MLFHPNVGKTSFPILWNCEDSRERVNKRDGGFEFLSPIAVRFR